LTNLLMNYLQKCPDVKGQETVGLAVLVHSHFSLAGLVEKTDQIFGPIIITYFATQVERKSS
jgi:hypothetical protein